MNDDTVFYRERLWPGLLGWVLLIAAVAVVVVTVSPLGSAAMVIAAGVMALLATAAGVGLSTVVQVTDGVLRAGSARIEVQWLGRPEILDRVQVHAALGPGSDARDYVLVRSWLPSALAIPVLDPADPTPRWMVSTRRPTQLAEAIERAQPAHSEQIG